MYGNEPFTVTVRSVLKVTLFVKKYCRLTVAVFMHLVEAHPNFKMVQSKPEYVNTCFWYIPPRLRTIKNQSVFRRQLSLVAPRIKQKLMERGNYGDFGPF